MTTTRKLSLVASVFAFCLASFLFLSFSSAVIESADLKKPVMISEEAALLGQVDTVSLYLSSDQVQFAPRLSKKGVIEVETTVLSPDLSSNQPKLNDFVSRNCTTFVSVLQDRLPTYAPAVAEKFDSTKDIVFNVNSGSSRESVGVWKGGVWQPNKEVAKLSVSKPADIKPAEQKIDSPKEEEVEILQTPGRKGCDCPARK